MGQMLGWSHAKGQACEPGAEEEAPAYLVIPLLLPLEQPGSGGIRSDCPDAPSVGNTHLPIQKHRSQPHDLRVSLKGAVTVCSPVSR